MSEELYATLTAEQTVNATIAIAKGDKGDKGDNGDAYVITEADKQEIKDSLSGDISELNGDIDAEANERKEADNAINASLESHGSRIDALESITVKVDSGGYIAVEYKN